MLKDQTSDASANSAIPDLVVENIGLPPELRIIGKISQGGIGAVFKGEDLRSHKLVAIKVLLPQLAVAERHQQRFIQEARTMSSLADPHIVNVHDCGISESGLPYLVMDYVDGITLEQVLTQRSVGTDEALEVFIQAAEAVGHAHSRGIIHRDLKPSNIMLIKEANETLFVKVLDFGIAKITEEALSDANENLTTTGELLGTPSYMSPEQSLGFPTGPCSDVYSLGCVMYHTLTGTPPFKASTALQLLAKHTNSPAPEIKKLRPDLKLPGGLDRIVRRTLEKQPEDRYANMEELLTDLRRVKDKTPLPLRLTGHQRHHLLLMVNVVIWFSVFYFAGQLLPGILSYFEHHGSPDNSFQESRTKGQP
jgi:eukaryotic-like serine/threonine-protein kinase